MSLKSYESWRLRSFTDNGLKLFVCHLLIFSKDYLSETTGSVSIKLHMQLSDKGEKKVVDFWSMANDQNGRRAHIWLKPLKNLLLLN